MTSRKKHIYLALIALGGVGLLVDRLLTPASIQAQTALLADGVSLAPRPRAGAAPDLSSVEAAGLSVPELPFPRGLPTWDPDQPLRDIFSPSADVTNPTRRPTKPGEAEGYGTCANLLRNGRLDALMVNERLKIAVINGQRVGVGAELQGCTLFSVEGSLVRFRCRDGETVITLTPAHSTPQG